MSTDGIGDSYVPTGGLIFDFVYVKLTLHTNYKNVGLFAHKM